MTRPGQKRQERWHLEQFVEGMGGNAPAPAMSFEAGENPDFVLPKPDGSALGIEFTVLHHPKQPQRQMTLKQEEGIQESICRKLESKWKDSGIPWGQTDTHFLGRQLPPKTDEPKDVDALLAIIRRVTDTLVEGTGDVTRDELWEHPVLGRLVQSVSISRYPGFARPYVHAPRAAFLPVLSHAVIQKAISQKNDRCLDYRKKCDKVWLVLVHNEMGLATHFDRRSLDLSDAFQTDFDRVWLLDAIDKRVVEVGQIREVGAR